MLQNIWTVPTCHVYCDTCPNIQLSKQVVVQSLDPLGLAGPGTRVVRGRHQARELLEVELQMIHRFSRRIKAILGHSPG